MCTLEPSLTKSNIDTEICKRCKRNYYNLTDDELENHLIEFGIFVPNVNRNKISRCNGFIDKSEGEQNEDCTSN